MISRLLAAPAVEPLTVREVIDHLRLGAENVEPAPNAPSVALAGVGAGAVNNGAHRYQLTFVTVDGETDGGDISDVVTVGNSAVDGVVSITNIPVGGPAVIARRIYRTTAGGDAFLYVGEIADNITTMYEDSSADAALGQEVPSTNTTRDSEVLRFIRTAREAAEQYLCKALITQKWRTNFSAFPANGVLRLPKPPLISVESVKYLDSAGVEQTLDPTEYTVDADSYQGAVRLRYGKTWPATLPEFDAVRVEFTCGYGSTPADVPELYRHGMKLLISDYNENREMLNVGNIVNDLPAVRRCFADRFKEFA